MGDLILDDQRFLYLFGEQALHENVGDNRLPADGLTTDQSKLSYSFDFRGAHFVVINTDPVGNDTHAPTNWLAADLRAAQARGAQHFFVFGHKPAYTYYYGAVVPPLPALPLPGKPSGLDEDPASRDDFWSVIEQYGATYFCAFGNAASCLEAFMHSKGQASFLNDPEIDAWFAQQATELDRKKREALLHKIQQKVYDEARFMPVWELTALHASGPRVGGIRARLDAAVGLLWAL